MTRISKASWLTVMFPPSPLDSSCGRVAPTCIKPLSGLHNWRVDAYVSGMRKTPKETIKIRRLPEKGEIIQVPLLVTRVGRNAFDTADVITVRIPGSPVPVTVNAEYLLGEDAED